MVDSEQMAQRRLREQSAATIGQLADTNIGQMIASLGTGIAQAQFELDSKSVQIAQLLSGNDVRVPSVADPTNRSKDEVFRAPKVPFGRWHDGTHAEFSLLELGFTPTFYQFVETDLEIKVSVSMHVDASFEQSRSSTTTTREKKTKIGFFKSKTTTKTRVETVSSRFSAQFQYSVEASSLVRTKLVPIPPPAVLLDILSTDPAR